MQQRIKILLIRFSSFGDVTQCLSVPTRLLEQFPNAEIHWVTRSEFFPLIEKHPAVKKVWALSKKEGLTGLFRISVSLRAENYTHIYDAHNNLRSFVITSILKPIPFIGPQLIVRSLKRWKRFLLFRFRINLFEKPFNGQRDLLEPLRRWGVHSTTPQSKQLYLPESKFALPFPQFIALAPSAAFFLKRWPATYWGELIKKFPDQNFVLLGGPEDAFLSSISDQFPKNVKNFAGKLSIVESAQMIQKSSLLVANDTGLLHVAEQLQIPAIALMGPAPFGFPSKFTTTILEKELDCRPCSKHGQGPCINKIHQACLVSITPDDVAIVIRTKLGLK